MAKAIRCDRCGDFLEIGGAGLPNNVAIAHPRLATKDGHEADIRIDVDALRSPGIGFLEEPDLCPACMLIFAEQATQWLRARLPDGPEGKHGSSRR